MPAPDSLHSAALWEAQELGETLGLCARVEMWGCTRALPVLLAAVVFSLCHQFKGQLLESCTSQALALSWW